jgi:hypothetical protein
LKQNKLYFLSKLIISIFVVIIILNLIKDLFKTEEIKSNKKENENDIEELPIIRDKLLIIDEQI